MAIKISGEPIINDNRFIVSPNIQKITTNTILDNGYGYRTVSSSLIIVPNAILTIEPEGSAGVGLFVDGASLTINRGSDVAYATNQYII